jgi:3-deoxy-D-manno-octulosonate 8-phosphate phosphatase (KDO 8-P phosphatase)
MELKKLGLLILDVDGVLTNGIKDYAPDGSVVAKRFNDKDFTAIKRFKEAGIEVVWLSGDDCVNKIVAEKRNIPFYHSRSTEGVLSKSHFVEYFQEKYNINWKYMAYVGDDYFDLDIIKKVGMAFCPSDAIEDVRKSCYPLDTKGGLGVVVELFNMYRNATGHETNDYKLREIDSKEK